MYQANQERDHNPDLFALLIAKQTAINATV
jgi:hypothetical protein